MELLPLRIRAWCWDPIHDFKSCCRVNWGACFADPGIASFCCYDNKTTQMLELSTQAKRDFRKVQELLMALRSTVSGFAMKINHLATRQDSESDRTKDLVQSSVQSFLIEAVGQIGRLSDLPLSVIYDGWEDSWKTIHVSLLRHHAMRLLNIAQTLLFADSKGSGAVYLPLPSLIQMYTEVKGAAWADVEASAGYLRNRFSMSVHHELSCKRDLPETGSELPSLAVESTFLDVMVLISDDFGNNAMSTINSLLHHAGQPASIRLHVVGNAVGLNSLEQAMMSANWLPLYDLSPLADVAFYNIFKYEEFVRRLNSLPFACIWRHNYGQVTWARLLFADLLPESVQRLVIMCLGDVVVLGDSWKELPKLFEDFQKDEFLGMWKALVTTEIKNTRVHTGVVLVDVGKLRKSSFMYDFVDASLHGVRRNEDQFCYGAEADVIHVYNSLYPGRIHVVSTAREWHFIPDRWTCKWWRTGAIPGGALGVGGEVAGWRIYCPSFLEICAEILLGPGGPQTLAEANDGLRQAMDTFMALRKSPDSRWCGKPVKLLHFPGRRLKEMPFAQWLLRWWSTATPAPSRNCSNSTVSPQTGKSEWSETAFRSKSRGIVETDAIGLNALQSSCNSCC